MNLRPLRYALALGVFGSGWAHSAASFNTALELMRKGRYAEAQAALAPLLREADRTPGVSELACELSLHRNRRGTDDLRWCVESVQTPGSGPQSRLLLADFRLRSGDVAGSVEDLRAAGAQLEAAGAGQAKLWSYLVSLYIQTGCLTWAEDALPRAEPARAAGLRLFALQQRRRLGLPRSELIAPDRESPFVTRFRAAEDDLASGKISRALMAAEQLSKELRGSPGPLVLLCIVHGRSGEERSARVACERAIEADGDAATAYFVLGAISANASTAAKNYRRALELDSTYRQTAQLQYRTRFGGDL